MMMREASRPSNGPYVPAASSVLPSAPNAGNTKESTSDSAKMAAGPMDQANCEMPMLAARCVDCEVSEM